MTAESRDYYPVVNEDELETAPLWFKCVLCGRPAMHFIAQDLALCDYCYAEDYA